MSTPETHNAGDHLALERLLLFSDAVFAIAITLLVIEIKVPVLNHHASNSELGQALIGMMPRFVGFVISFFLIGQTWIEHHSMGRMLRGFDRGLLWKNLLLLFFVAFMPFATALASELFMSSLAGAFYSFVFLGMGLAKVWFWRHAVTRGLAVTSPDSSSISRRVWGVPITAGAITIVGGFGIPYAMCGFALIPVVVRLLDRPQSRQKPATDIE
jgi:uncharacterized membrane protein